MFVKEKKEKKKASPGAARHSNTPNRTRNKRRHVRWRGVYAERFGCGEGAAYFACFFDFFYKQDNAGNIP
ncbi:MAG: hypothetical protein ABUT20_15065 [Bacteroidota bacterium]